MAYVRMASVYVYSFDLAREIVVCKIHLQRLYYGHCTSTLFIPFRVIHPSHHLEFMMNFTFTCILTAVLSAIITASTTFGGIAAEHIAFAYAIAALITIATAIATSETATAIIANQNKSCTIDTTSAQLHTVTAAFLICFTAAAAAVITGFVLSYFF